MNTDVYFSPEKIVDVYDLTPLQRGMVFHSMGDVIDENAERFYIEQVQWVMNGPLNIEIFKQSWLHMVERHTALRSLVRWEDLSRPYQIVLQEAPLSLIVRDMPADTNWEQVAKEERYAVPDMRFAPPLRLLLAQLDEHEWRIIWTCHHVIIDGWSGALMVQELSQIYEQLMQGSVLVNDSVPIQFGAFSAWCRARGKQDENYWRMRMRHYEHSSPLIVHQVGGEPSRAVVDESIYTLCLSLEETQLLAKATQKHQITLAVLLQGAVALLLARYSGWGTVCFGQVTSIRPTEIEGINQALGMFVNTVPVLAKVNNGEHVADWLKQLAQHDIEGREHGCLPLSEIHRVAGVSREQELFDVLLAVENVYGRTNEEAVNSFCGCIVSEYQIHEKVNNPLSIIVYPQSQIRVRFLFDTKRFSKLSVQRIALHFKNILFALSSAQPDELLGGVSIFSPEEKQSLLALGRGDDSRLASVPTSVVEMFKQVCFKNGQAIALVDDEGVWTYDKLDMLSSSVAQSLGARLIGVGETVAVFMQKGCPMVAAILGVLKAGAAYLALDITYPQERLAHMLQVAKVKSAICDGTRDFSSLGVETIEQLNYENLHDEVLAQTYENSAKEQIREPQGEDTAYVIFTSGSTGVPKGMRISHEGLAVCSCAFAERLGLTANDRVMALASPCFDAAVIEIFMAIAVGASIAIVPREKTIPGQILQESINQLKASSAVVTPSVLRTLNPKELPLFNKVAAGGEVCPVDLALSWLRGRHFFNAYGPAEACVVTACAEYRQDGLLDYVGRPLAGEMVYIVNEAGHLLPTGVVGEICIASIGLTLGYIGDDEKNKDKFVTNAFWQEGDLQQWQRYYRTGDAGWLDDLGHLHIQGRIDTQVKIDGVRIEVEEIEAVLESWPVIKAAVVAVTKNHQDRLVLGAFLELQMPSKGIDEGALRGFLLERLPAAAVPSLFQVIDILPVTANGKVDRKTLSERLKGVLVQSNSFESRQDHLPMSQTESVLASLWKEVLSCKNIGKDADFFRLGGDSIAVLQVVSKAKEKNIPLKVEDVFRHPTLALLAQVIDGNEEHTDNRVPDLKHDEATGENIPALSLFQQWYSNMVFKFGDGALWHTTASALITAPLHPEYLESACQEVVKRHEVFRLGLVLEDGLAQAFDCSDHELEFHYHDLRTSDEPSNVAQSMAVDYFAKALPMDKPPLLRVLCFQLPDERWVWTVIFHRLIADPGTRHLFFEEAKTFYIAALQKKSVYLPTSIAYRQFVEEEWQFLNSSSYQSLRRQWSREIAPYRHIQRQPYEEDRQAQRRLFHLSEDASALVREVSSTHGYTEFSILLAAYARTLAIWQPCEGLNIAIPVNRRENRHEHMAGPVSDEVQISFLTSEMTSFPDLLDVVTHRRNIALACSFIPIADLLKQYDPQAMDRPDAGATYAMSLYRSAVEYQNAQLHYKSQAWNYPRHTTVYDAMLIVWDTEEEFQLMLEHRLGFISKAKAQLFIDQYSEILLLLCELVLGQEDRVSNVLTSV